MPDKVFSGNANGSLTLDIKKGLPISFDFESDLLGAGIEIPVLSWKKETTLPANFQISGTFSKPITISQFKLKSKDFSTSGDMDFDDVGVKNISLYELKVGKWLSSNIILVQDLDPYNQKVSFDTLNQQKLICRISIPFISHSKDWAIIFYSCSSDATDGSGDLYIYRKLENKWIYYHKINLFIP